MLIIGIAGGTGSGKTTVVHQIMNELPQTEVGYFARLLLQRKSWTFI
jgi:uridine kinase